MPLKGIRCFNLILLILREEEKGEIVGFTLKPSHLLVMFLVFIHHVSGIRVNIIIM